MFTDLQQRLRDAGIPPTPKRMAVGMVLFRHPVHMTAEQVFDAAQAHLPGISRATVEATMQRFVDRGLLRELLVDTLAVVYDSTVRPHHHVYDVDTRRVSDLAGEVRVLGVPDLGDLQVCGIDVVVRVRRINGARADSRSPAPAAPPPA